MRAAMGAMLIVAGLIGGSVGAEPVTYYDGWTTKYLDAQTIEVSDAQGRVRAVVNAATERFEAPEVVVIRDETGRVIGETVAQSDVDDDDVRPGDSECEFVYVEGEYETADGQTAYVSTGYCAN